MRGLLITIAIAAAVAGCSGNKAEVGPLATKDFPVGNFTILESAGSYDVTVRTGAQPSVRAEGPQEMLERLIVEVRGDRLSIRPKNGNFNWRSSQPVRIAVTVPELHEAVTAGSGSINVDKVSGDRFKAIITGSGEIAVPSVSAKSVEINIAGSGSGKLGGQAEQADYVITGSGDLDASNLKARDVKLTIAGSGAVAANASATATGDVLGSGEARISGGAECRVTKAGSGSVVCS